MCVLHDPRRIGLPCMKLTVDSQDDGVVRLSVSGSVSQAHVTPFAEPLVEVLGESAFSRKLLLDLSEVESLDSSGVNWLLICQKKMSDAGGQLVLHSLSPIAKNVLKVLNLHTVFKLADDADAAAGLLEGDG